MTDDEVKKYAQDLIGCCDGHNNATNSQHIVYEVLTQAQRELLDEICFLCDCGWWCSMDEANETGGGWLCDDCAESQNDEPMNEVEMHKAGVCPDDCDMCAEEEAENEEEGDEE